MLPYAVATSILAVAIATAPSIRASDQLSKPNRYDGHQDPESYTPSFRCTSHTHHVAAIIGHPAEQLCRLHADVRLVNHQNPDQKIPSAGVCGEGDGLRSSKPYCGILCLCVREVDLSWYVVRRSNGRRDSMCSAGTGSAGTAFMAGLPKWIIPFCFRVVCRETFPCGRGTRG